MTELQNCKILIVDDIKINISILVQALKTDYQISVAPDGEAALEHVKNNSVDLILLDIMMPGMDGYQVCKELKKNKKTHNIPIIFITAMNDPGDKTRGFAMGAVDYITKPFYIAEVKARVRTHLTLKLAQEALANQNKILDQKVKERTRELEQTQIDIINRLGMASEYHDLITGNHVKRVSAYCEALAEAAGLSEDEVQLIGLASKMHDVGKIGIETSILQKPDHLSCDEWEIMKTHPLIGADLLAGSESKLIQLAEVIALTHHEKWDGTGYPNGLKGEEIPLVGRIACICDVFDALTTDRPYKETWDIEHALKEIKNKKGSHLDPKLVRLFCNLKTKLKKILAELG
jgi:putative two-component system response regulator